MKADKATFIVLIIIVSSLLSCTLVKAKALSRPKRQAEYDDTDPGAKEPDGSGEGQAEAEAEDKGKKGGGVSLGKILGLAFLACCIIYCIGISWKVYKVCKGTYVEEEPVFLKYKWTLHLLNAQDWPWETFWFEPWKRRFAWQDL